MIKRPTNKELFNKIRKARQAVQAGRIEIVDAVSIAVDAIELGYDVGTELNEILKRLLNDISHDHYTGSRPPQKAYESVIQNLELFAFTVDSDVLEEKVYLKFALSGEAIWLVSLHKDRPYTKGE